MKALSILCLSIVIVSFAMAQGIQPKEGFVPNQETAIRIAEAVLIPIYGKDRLESERPFTAELKENKWTVYGTLRCSDGKSGSTTVGCRGGVATVEISKLDARVLSVSHGR
jgi:NTF2 fold immunity protein of polymorphic toxin system component